MDDVTPMKLDAIDLGYKRKMYSVDRINMIKILRSKLRRFFDEGNGHGSLIRQPPPSMVTPQYFKTIDMTSYYPVQRMNWIAFVNTNNYKKKITEAENPVKVQRPCAIKNVI